MNLYKIRFTVEAREIGKTAAFDVILEGGASLSKEGDWSAVDKTSETLMDIYFGDTEGFWEYKPSGESATIWLYNHDSPNFLSQLWRTPMGPVAMLTASNKWPAAAGEKFSAMYWGAAKFDCTWTVVHRYF